VEKTVEDVENRIHGVVAEVEGVLREETEVPDAKLEARVRSRLGRLTDRPHGIQVYAKDGRVYLLGTVSQEDATGIIKGVHAVPGVKEVINQFHVPAVKEKGPVGWKAMLGLAGTALCGIYGCRKVVG